MYRLSEVKIFVAISERSKVIMRQIKDNGRIAWVDIAKGLGIFLVVLGHTYRKNPVQNWIYSFHMPLFFILSGWLRGG